MALALLLTLLQLPTGILATGFPAEVRNLDLLSWPADQDRIPELLGEIRSGDAAAREYAAGELIALGESALPAIREELDRGAPASAELALRRVFSAITGLSPEEASHVDRWLNKVRTDAAPDLRRASLDLLDLGDAALDYTRRQIGDDATGAMAELSRRLCTLRAVRDLALGHNLADRAAARLSGVGDAVLEELAVLASDSALPGAWRSVALERLVQLGGDSAFEPTLALAADPEVRQIAVPWLCAAAPTDRFAEVASQTACARAAEPALNLHLAQLADRLDSTELREHLRHDEASVRAAAAIACGARRDRDAAGPLRQLAGKRKEVSEVVAAALTALGRVGGEDALDAIVRHLDHKQVAVRRAALEAVAALDDSLSAAWIATALKDPAPALRVQAATLLGRSGNESATAALISSLYDSDPGVVSAASFGLARLTGEPHTGLTVSSDDARDALREAWRDWRVDQAAPDQQAADEGEDSDDDSDPALPLAEEGRRILDELAGELQRQFRPYGELKDEDGTAPEALRDAVIEGMLEVVDRDEDADDPDLLVLEAEAGTRSILRHLLRHGEFADAADVARSVGSLPMEFEARDYILMVYDAAHAMVDSLGDRFTRLSLMSDADGNIDPDSIPSLFGKGKTMGMILEESDAGAVVDFVFALMPGHRAGIRPGDQVLSINGELTNGMEKRKLRRLLKEKAVLSILRDGWTRPVPFTIEPAELNPEDLVTTAMLPGGIGYVRLQQFELGCAQRIEWAIRDLEKQGITGLILDLRNNPGGTVLDATAIVDTFIGEGETLTTMWTNHWDEDEEYLEQITESTASEADRTFPMAVLINKCSASASEMTSGSLQDLERAVVVGRTSWGKGIGQSGGAVVGFPRESAFGESRATLQLGITILEYFLPTGRSIQGIGVEPDIPVNEPILLGDRFELMRRAAAHPKTTEYLDNLLETDAAAALELARFDAWDADRWPGFADLQSSLSLELNTNLLRMAIRGALRDRLMAEHCELLRVDIEEDEDVRAAIAAIASDCELDLETLPEYEDLAE